MGATKDSSAGLRGSLADKPVHTHWARHAKPRLVPTAPSLTWLPPCLLCPQGRYFAGVLLQKRGLQVVAFLQKSRSNARNVKALRTTPGLFGSSLSAALWRGRRYEERNRIQQPQQIIVTPEF